MVVSMSSSDIDLQLFADGGTSGGGAGSNGGTGATGSDAGNQVKGNGGAAPTGDGADGADDEAEYQKFRERFKTRLDADTEKAVKGRVRNLKPKADQHDRMAPIIRDLAYNYGIDERDLDTIAKRVKEDTSGLEKRAYERGVDVETEKHIEELERKARESDEMRKQQERAAKYAEWKKQEADVKRQYPEFDLDAVSEASPRFNQLLALGWTALDAYESAYAKELRERALQIGADQATQKVMGTIKSNQSRPSEGAARGRMAGNERFDVTKISDEKAAEIRRRVASGERITAEMLEKGFI